MYKDEVNENVQVRGGRFEKRGGGFFKFTILNPIDFTIVNHQNSSGRGEMSMHAKITIIHL